jgi:V-type H+-transporting ATPase subunit H
MDEESDTTKAIACYDCGEFAKYFPAGKTFLDKLEVKSKVYALMAEQNSSAELKKEAITCLQKLLISSWGGKE